MQNTLQEQVAQRIYELLPHKKKLEFGCEVKAQRWNKNQNLSWGKGAFIQKDMFSGNPYIMYSKNDLDFAYHKIEIIGQPLRLADLLMAIEKVIGDTNIVYVNSLGYIYLLDTSKSYDKQFNVGELVQYNLSQDNLLNQSNELCELCLGLLNK